jgi:hypothetical protein
VLEQGVTGYCANALAIEGTGSTIKWVNNTIPTPNANKTDIETFTIFRNNAGAWLVLGDYGTYG